MIALTNSKPLGNTRQIPNGLDSNLGDGKFAGLIEANLAVWH